MAASVNKMYPSMIMKMMEEEEKEKKGYIFDSLVFRYKLAREAQMRANIETSVRFEKMTGGKKTSWEIEKFEKGLCDRDIMRFLEILDKAIGEHD